MDRFAFDVFRENRFDFAPCDVLDLAPHLTAYRYRCAEGVVPDAVKSFCLDQFPYLGFPFLSARLLRVWSLLELFQSGLFSGNSAILSPSTLQYIDM